MVMHRHRKYSASNARNMARVLAWLSVSVVLVACGARDEQTIDGGPLAEAPSPSTPIGDDSGQPPPTQLARPDSVLLKTLEEQPIDGNFALQGEAAGETFPIQQYTVATEPLNGTIVHADQARQFTYLPNENFFGMDFFTYSVAGGHTARVTIEVVNVKDAPILFAEVQGVVEQGSPYSASLIGSDPDNDALTYAAVNLPNWLSLDAQSGLLSGIPTMADVGIVENITFSVTDATGLRDEVNDVRIEVIETNDAPNINLDQFPSQLDAGQAIEVHLFPDDPDDEAVEVTFEANDLLDVTVTGGTVDVIAAEVSAVTETNLVLLAVDARGGATRSVVPFTIYPINATGRGRTLLGRDGDGVGVHLVVLGDGYREDQIASFRKHVELVISKMQADAGMSTHLSAWNVHMVETPSVDSGIDDNLARDIRNTVFDTGYFCKMVRRLICGDKPKMYNVAISEYPDFDQILVLVNDSRYGGSGSGTGGNIAISSTESIEIALHEMGHSIAGLADEYVDQYIPVSSFPNFVEGRFANVSASSDPTQVPWKHWLSEDGASTEPDNFVGIYQGAYYRADGFYRPTLNSLMRSYDGLLGPVNSEQWALSVYARTNPVISISPVNRNLSVIAGEVVEFSVEPLFDDSIQSVEWTLDSRVIPDSGTAIPSVSLSFPAGRYELGLHVRDITGLIRKPEPHAGVFTWNWTIDAQ